ncbi:transposase, partial [Colletotrichum incanum]
LKDFAERILQIASDHRPLEVQAIKPANRYNMDETGILKGKGSNGLVLRSSEVKAIQRKQPGS